MTHRVRALTDSERETLEALTRSRTAPAYQVERARIVWHAHEGLSAPKIAARLNIHAQTARDWIQRFNAEGLNGLADKPRSGRPAVYTAEQVAEVVATALTDPASLDVGFGAWTLDRLQAYLNEVKGIPIKRSRIDDVLLAEGLRWRQQETWFGEKVDPKFAEKKRGL
jgi:transposase